MFISRLQVTDSKTNLRGIRLIFLCCRRRLGETRLPEALSAILKPTFVSVQHVCMRLMLVRDGRFVVFVLPLTHIVKVAYRAIFATADMCAQHCTPAVAALSKPCPGSSLHLALLQQKASKFQYDVGIHVSMPWMSCCRW
jgi:hypothetical protein